MKTNRISLLFVALSLSMAISCSIMMKTIDHMPKMSRKLNNENDKEELHLYNSNSIIGENTEGVSMEAEAGVNKTIKIDGQEKTDEVENGPIVDSEGHIIANKTDDQIKAEEREEQDHSITEKQDQTNTEMEEELREDESTSKQDKITPKQEETDIEETTVENQIHKVEDNETIQKVLAEVFNGKEGNRPVIIINASGSTPQHHESDIHDATHIKTFDQNALPSHSQHHFSNDIGLTHTHKSQETSVNDVDSMLTMLDRIRSIYDSYYDALPSNEAENKSVEEHELDVIRFYAKIRDFIKTVMMNKHNLLSDLVFIHDKVTQLRSTEEDMLKFYRLSKQFFDIKMQSSKYQELDKKFDLYFKQISGYTLSFDDQIKKINASSADLFKLNDFFSYDIDQLEQSNTTNKAMGVLDKVDQVLNLTVKLIELKIDMENSIEVIKSSLMEIKHLRIKIEEEMLNVQKLTEFYALQESKGDKFVKAKGSYLATAFISIVSLFLVI